LAFILNEAWDYEMVHSVVYVKGDLGLP
jgi:hypothetical protein